MANFNVWTESTASGNLRVRHRNPDGSQHTDYCIDKNDRLEINGKWLTAQSIAKLYEERVRRTYHLKQLGEFDLRQPLEPLFEDFILECQSNNLARSTIAAYTYTFRRMQKAGFILLLDLNKEKLREWKIALMKAKFSPTSISQYLVVAMTFMRWLVENEKIPPFAFKKLLPKKKESEPKFYTPEEFKALSEAAAKINSDIYLLCHLAHGAGLRGIEMAGDGRGRRGVLYSDIIWKENREADLVLRKEIVKGQKRSRTIPLDPGLIELLGSRREGPILKRGRFTLQRDFARARKAAGLSDKHTIHGLRHTFAKNYLQSGGNLRGLMDLLGHVDLKTTQIYSHLELSFKAEAIKAAYEKRLGQEALMDAGNIALKVRGANEGQLGQNR